MNRKITLIFSLLILGFVNSLKAQCPNNIDFEIGLTPGWLYYTGSVATGPVYTFGAAGAPVAGYHELTTLPGTDAYGGFPIVSPGGGLHSLKILHDLTGSPASRARYYVHVPTVAGTWSLIYRYAVVLNNPSHGVADQPRMIVSAVDSATGAAVPCTNYTYVAGGSVPGFLLSALTAPADGTPVYYKTWTLGNMKFPGLGGHTITLDVIANGCALGGHFGYGYFDMSCGFYANSLVTCAYGPTTLSGPDGFAGYAWYDSTTFTTSYGTSQSVSISSPSVATTYAVILTPYTGYGCTDTLYTRVVPSTISLAPSNDTTICSGNSVTLHAGATSTYTPITYFWGPSAGLSCTTCASPVATPTVSTNYYVVATDGNGCTKTDTIHVTVFANPGTITGPTSVCLGQTVALGCTPAGGTWSTSSSAIAGIGTVTGIVTGNSLGVATITYTIGGSCKSTRAITVNPLPSVITGPGVMCVGTSTTLFDSTGGGTWTTTSGLINLGSASGVATGISSGFPVVTYTVPGTGCFRTRTLTVNPLPNLITGATTVCVGGTANVIDISPGGTWSASPSTTGSITPATGIITGIAPGPLTVTYTLATGCSISTTVNVLATPGPISGPNHVCIGDTIYLTDPTAGGSWNASTGDVAIPDPTTGLIIGEPAGGTTIISYTAGTSPCPSIYSVTVNPYTSPISVLGGGTAQVCVNSNITLTDADPGTWSASNTAITTIGSISGFVSGIATGVDTITFTNNLGCRATIPVSVNPLPAVPTGLTNLCVGTTITLSDVTPGGTFSTSLISPHASVTGSGTVTGISTGVQVITYSSSLGCISTYNVTVNTTPPHITGTLSVCQGIQTVLTDSITGGIWSITPTTTANIVGTVTSATVTGVAPGTATVTYALGLGCSTSSIVTVNPMPGAILPATEVVCVGSSTLTLSDPSTPGGTWGPATGTNANINPVSGNVTGVNQGLQVFTYTSATGCTRTTTVNVNPLPLAISGPSSVCVGSTITLSDGSGGGTWTSLNPVQGTITPVGGVFTGLSPVSATVKYQLPTGCATATVVNVNPLPSLFNITGGGAYCAGGIAPSIGLTGSSVGINYRISIGGVPTGPSVAGTGAALNFGPQAAGGVYTIVATNPITGCFVNMNGTKTITVNPVPVITGPTALCVGATITEVSSIAGSTWLSSFPGNASVGALSGIVTGITTGSSTVITCTSPAPASCPATITVNVTPSPGVPTGSSTVCVGDSTLFSDIPSGGSWSTSASTIASVATLSGYVTGVSAGTATITYSLGSGCTQTKNITVIAQPAAITGPMVICQGASTLLHDATSGGTWSVAPGSTSLAVVSTGGNVTANITGGTTTTQAAILYAAPLTGCKSWAFVTINPLPAPITGTFQVCQGSTTSFTDATGGGTWGINTTLYATMSGAGVVTGNAAGGPSIISYSVAGCSATAAITVNPLPSVIAGSSHVCTGSSTTLSSTAGGTWVVAPTTVATISPTSGSLYGVAPGSAVVTYTLPTGCLRSTPVTVNVTPAPIVGPASVCVGHTASLSDPTGGGSWSSSNTTIATIGASTGLVGTNPPNTGLVNISYTIGSCSAVAPFNVLAPPMPITGTLHVCVRDSTLLADATLGGTWSCGSPSLATISSTGMVTGIASGTVIITYGAAGCYIAAPVIVNPISNVLGDSVVCVGQSIDLTDTTLGGYWTALTPSLSVGTGSGVVTGVAPTVAGVIKYYVPATGCQALKNVTVNTLPSAITGPSAVCVNQTITLNDATPGGGWTSSDGTIATVDVSGNVTGVNAGVATITYTLSTTGCVTTASITVNPLPSAIVGASNMCIGSYDTFTCAGVGTWTSSNTAVATVGLGTGLVYAAGLGSTHIVYTLSGTGCYTSMALNVISQPSAIYMTTPPAVVCQGSSITLIDSSGTGTWTSASPSTAYVAAGTGVVTGINAGTTIITYSTGVGCYASATVTVETTPDMIAGSSSVCVGQTALLTSFPGGGTWSSSLPAYGSIDLVGNVTGVAPGSTTITYALSTGCSTSRTEFINATPPNISGFPKVCVGLTTPLNDAAPGGIWASSNTAAATVDAFGVVTGVAPGITTISYTISGTTCPATMVVTVSNTPSAITGTAQVCVGFTTLLSEAVPGNGWTSADPAVATIDLTGLVTGMAAGTTDVSYTAGYGCFVIQNVTVNPIPAAIIGGDSVCQGQFLFFSDPTPYGTWSSSNPAVGNVTANTGVMAGVASGTTSISYTVAGCSVSHQVTVDVQPAPITGNPIVCYNGTSALHDAVPGGIWSSSATGIAPVSATGVVFGSALGNSTITYIMFPGACMSTLVVTVVPLPAVYTVSGGGTYCAGGNGVPINLSNSAVGVNYLLYDGPTATGTFAGTGSPLNFGLQTVAGTYTVIATTTATGCSQSMAGNATVNVTPTTTPSVSLTSSPSSEVCTGTAVTINPVPVNGGLTPVFQWNVNGTSVGTSGSYTFVPANGDVVGVNMISSFNCPAPLSVSATLTLTVDPFATPTVGIAAHPNDTVCDGSLISLTPNTVHSGSAPTYNWYKNGVNVSSAANYSFVPVNHDAVFCIMHNNYLCALNSYDTSAEMLITVEPYIEPLVSINVSPNTIVSVGQTVTMRATVVNGGLAPTYQWLKNAVPIVGATNAIYTSDTFKTSEIADSFSCVVTSSGLCPVTAHQWVYINVANVGVGQVKNGNVDIAVLPNPNKGDFMIKGSLGTTADEEVAVEITDVLGQTVFQGKVMAHGGKINEHVTLGGNLANGMYVLALRTSTDNKVFHLVIEQ